MPLFHAVFDKFYPLIRFVHERVNHNPWFSEIAPQLWLGGAPTYPRDYAFLTENGITAVVNIRAERDDDQEFYRQRDINYLRLHVYDMTVPGSAELEAGAVFIDEQVRQGRTVLVHCAKGRGRSAVLLAAYLVGYRGMTFDEAVAFMKARRPLVKQETRHRRAVERWLAERAQSAEHTAP